MNESFTNPLDMFTPQTILEDITLGKGKPLWPLSSYGPARYKDTIIGGLDVSPEELRVEAWEAVRKGKIDSYVKYEGEWASGCDGVFNAFKESAHLNNSSSTSSAFPSSPLPAFASGSSFPPYASGLPGGNMLVYCAPLAFAQSIHLSSVPHLEQMDVPLQARTEVNTGPTSSSRTPMVSNTHLHYRPFHDADNKNGDAGAGNAFASTSSLSSFVEEGVFMPPEDATAGSANQGRGSFDITVANLRRDLGFKRKSAGAGDGQILGWTLDSLASYHKHDKFLIQKLVDVLQSDLDYTDQGHSDSLGISLNVYRMRGLQSLRHLATRYEILPSSLFIKELQRDGQNPIGGGGFADIWRGIAGSNQSICLKVLRLILEPDEDVREKIRKQFCNEALVWRQLKHPNILPLLGVNVELFYPSFCLVSPWMENQDIIAYLKKNLTHNRYDVLSEVAAGLSYLHSRDPPVIHGDIRGANILVTADLHCCLADFGLSVVTTESQIWSNVTTTNIRGATRWMAPELQIPDGAGKLASNRPSTDVYAFGCTIIEILTLQPPFNDKKTDGAIIHSLLIGERPNRPQRNDWCTDSLWELMNRCWTQDPSARPISQEIHGTLQRIRMDI
ncbi:hypothetical protein GYMLUDRAFT_258825 [Collybiopsis luxurians FD-317 M1]|nr:hypothetical protein GYMLUDRAFT_258825 [Collybiopsis luxurians FD-317 M1]